MSGFTGGIKPPRRKTLDQRGESMISLFIWIFLALAVIGGVVSLFVSSSKTTAISAQHTQQQGAIQNAMNRVSRDVTDSDPIVYASNTELVVDVLGSNAAGSNTVERRRYLYLPASNSIVWQKKNVPTGTSYDAANPAVEWPTTNKQTVIVTDMKPLATGDEPIFKFYDKNAAVITSLPATGSAAEGIARVDLQATANVFTKGNVSLTTSAVPRSRVIGDTPLAPAIICPSFTSQLNPDKTVTLRWSSSSGATSYVVNRNGVDLTPTITVTDPSAPGYQFIDTPDTASSNTQVFVYLLKVTNSGGTTSCRDTTQTVIMETPATPFTAELIPATVFNAPNDPKSTGWANSSELTRVRMTWDPVLSGSGYQLFRQQKDASGNLIGTNRSLIFSTDDPSVTNYTYTVASADDGENWEWSIKVLARTGDNDQSNRVTLLTYPTPVTQTAVTAQTYNVNVLTWTGHNAGLGSLGYEIYRSPLDPSGTPLESTFTKIGNTASNVQTFTDSTAELGSTYWYYVVSKNTSGFSNQFSAKKVTQLQFPPDPVMVAAKVAGDGGSQDISDGSNRVNWSLAKSAAGYQVFRTDIKSGAQACLTGTTCKEFDATAPAATPVAPNTKYGNYVAGTVVSTATSYTDSSSVITPATKFRYIAYAYNKTGPSKGLSAAVTITQRPAAPTINKTLDPTLDSTKSSISWDKYSGGWWCNNIDAGDTQVKPENACTYAPTQFNNDGTQKFIGSVTGGTFDFNNQDWGRHYTYSLTAKNVAFYKGGVSNPSNVLSADTYPGDFGIDVKSGDPWGNNKQRYMFDTTAITSNTNETTHTLGSQGALYFSIGWGASAGAKKFDWVRDGGAGSPTSADSTVAMPSATRITGTVTSGAGNWAYSYAAPGSTYWTSITATSLENNLTRPKNPAPIVTAADIPQSGYQQIVCSGPWDAPPPQIQTSSDAVMYARQTFTAQSFAGRLVSFNKAPRYGAYSNTIVYGRFQDANNIGSTSYWRDSAGVNHLIEQMAKGSIGYYQGGTWNNIAAGSPTPASIDSNGVGQSPYRYSVGTGMQIYNQLNGNPALDSYWLLTVIDEGATREGCAPSGQFQEPFDACYEWNAQDVCYGLNQNGVDGRPRWISK